MKSLRVCGECVGALTLLGLAIALGYGAAMHVAERALIVASW